jgi:hypothetical protein
VSNPSLILCLNTNELKVAEEESDEEWL